MSSQGTAPQLVYPQVMHDAEQPGAQIAARPPLGKAAPGSFQRVLHQIVRRRTVAEHRPRIAAQAGQLGKDRAAVHGVGSGTGDVPDVVESVAGLVARLLVLGPGIQRLALEGPLLLAVVANHNAVVAAGGIAVHREQWRPVGGARAVAHALAAAGSILVEDVQSHAVTAGEYVAGHHGRRRRPGSMSGTGSQRGRNDERENQIIRFHDDLRWLWGALRGATPRYTETLLNLFHRREKAATGTLPQPPGRHAENRRHPAPWGVSAGYRGDRSPAARPRQSRPAIPVASAGRGVRRCPK